MVHTGNIQDRDGAKLLLGRLVGRFPRLKLIRADGAYGGELIDWVKTFFGWDLEIVKRPKEQKGFVVSPPTLGSGANDRVARAIPALE